MFGLCLQVPEKINGKMKIYRDIRILHLYEHCPEYSITL